MAFCFKMSFVSFLSESGRCLASLHSRLMILAHSATCHLAILAGRSWCLTHALRGWLYWGCWLLKRSPKESCSLQAQHVVQLQDLLCFEWLHCVAVLLCELLVPCAFAGQEESCQIILVILHAKEIEFYLTSPHFWQPATKQSWPVGGIGFFTSIQLASSASSQSGHESRVWCKHFDTRAYPMYHRYIGMQRDRWSNTVNTVAHQATARAHSCDPRWSLELSCGMNRPGQFCPHILLALLSRPSHLERQLASEILDSNAVALALPADPAKSDQKKDWLLQSRLDFYGFLIFEYIGGTDLLMLDKLPSFLYEDVHQTMQWIHSQLTESWLASTPRIRRVRRTTRRMPNWLLHSWFAAQPIFRSRSAADNTALRYLQIVGLKHGTGATHMYWPGYTGVKWCSRCVATRGQHHLPFRWPRFSSRVPCVAQGWSCWSGHASCPRSGVWTALSSKAHNAELKDNLGVVNWSPCRMEFTPFHCRMCLFYVVFYSLAFMSLTGGSTSIAEMEDPPFGSFWYSMPSFRWPWIAQDAEFRQGIAALMGRHHVVTQSKASKPKPSKQGLWKGTRGIVWLAL